MAKEKDFEALQERLSAARQGSLGDDSPLKAGKGPAAEKRMEKAVKTSKKPVYTREKDGEDAESPKGPVGLDIGTSHIVAAQNKRNYVNLVQELNAFFTVPSAKFAKEILNQKNIKFYEREDQYYIFGYSAENFANMFNVNTRRPMKDGFLSPKEDEGLSVIKAITNSILNKPKEFGQTLCYGVPGEPIDGTGSVVYHESILSRFLSSLGYSPISINEGMAIVISELSEDDFTGIGISMGGGMCNVCLSYLSFPVLTYSIQMAGDYIDTMVGKSVGEPATKIRTIKEQDLDLSKEPKDRIATALHIFYDELIFKVLESLQRVIRSTEKIPTISVPIPIVFSGGTAMPNGYREKFESMFKKVELPLEISDIRVAEDPLSTTAKGALIMAMTEAG